jgi:hypothetical protein
LIHLGFLLVFSIWVLCFVYCHSALLPKFELNGLFTFPDIFMH